MKTSARAVTPWLAASLLLAAAASPAVSSPPAAWEQGATAAADSPEPCPADGLGDLTPGAVSTAGVAEPGRQLRLRVLVLLDGVSVAEARPIVTGAQQAYRALAVDLRIAYRPVRLAADGVAKGGQPTGGAFFLIDQMRSRYPVPPPGFDLVHLLTAKDVVDDANPNRDGTDSRAGVAACVGGIRYQGEQLSVSEARYRYWQRGSADDIRVITMVHEIAHLLGAHHQHGNCHEGRSTQPGAAGSCTVMLPIGAMSSTRFGRLETAVVRGYVEEYGAP